MLGLPLSSAARSGGSIPPSVGERGLRWYEPDRDRWVHGPPLEAGVVVNRMTRVSHPSGERRETPDEFMPGGIVDYEYPLAGVVPGGPIVWLGEPTPAVLHPSRGVWDAPRKVLDARKRSRISSGPEMIRTRATASVGPDGRIYAIGGFEHRFLNEKPTASVEMLDTASRP